MKRRLQCSAFALLLALAAPAAAQSTGEDPVAAARAAVEAAIAAKGADDPAAGQAHMDLGAALFHAGDLEGARAELQRASEILLSGTGVTRPRSAIQQSACCKICRKGKGCACDAQ